MSFFEDVLRSLDASGARYVVVGGLAVVLQGHPRLTIDVDVVVDLDPQAAALAIEALTSIGLRPTVPVDPQQFADPAVRTGWIRDKNMKVFRLQDPNDITRHVNVFVEDPIPFEELWARADTVEYGGLGVRVASLADLITMKRAAARPKDLADIEVLEQMKGYVVNNAGSADWPVSWEEHALAQLRDELSLTPDQRMRWLEEAIQLALETGALAGERHRRDSEFSRLWNGGSA